MFTVGKIVIYGKRSRSLQRPAPTRSPSYCTGTCCKPTYPATITSNVLIKSVNFGQTEKPTAEKPVAENTAALVAAARKAAGEKALSEKIVSEKAATTPVTRLSRSGSGVAMLGLKGGALPTKPDLWTPSPEVTVIPSKIS